MSLGTIHALAAQDVCQRGETKAGVDGDSLVASWEELDAVPVALFRFRVRTLSCDSLRNGIWVDNLRAQEKQSKRCEGHAVDMPRRDATESGECAHHAGPWGEAPHFGEDDIANVIRDGLLCGLSGLCALLAHCLSRLGEIGRWMVV